VAIDLPEVLAAVRDWPRSVRRRWHLRGRRAVEGRRLRYDACSDIPLVVLAMLKEFVADCESPYFHCVQDENLAALRPLITEGERIANDEYDTEVWISDNVAWADWLRRVSDVLPGLWD
jgi:hypothetical protein